MVYNYLLDLYQELDKRKENIEMMIAQAADDMDKRTYQKGRLRAVDDFKNFLTTNYHTKLPRRMQKHPEMIRNATLLILKRPGTAEDKGQRYR